MSVSRLAEEPTAAVLDLTSPALSNELAELDGRLHVLQGLLDASERLADVNKTIQFCPDKFSALVALQNEPFGYSRRQAEAVLDMPMSWQTAEEVARLQAELDLLTERRANLREHVAEVLALHWFG
jgi:DNA gyrase/topoisomerase IV subunit A